MAHADRKPTKTADSYRLFFILCSVFCVLCPILCSAAMPTEPTFTNSIGMKFARIEGGSFRMGFSGELAMENMDGSRYGGSDRLRAPAGGDFDERPVHKVTITEPFYMAVSEVTNDQYELFDRLHEKLRGEKGFSIDGDEAAVYVSWHEAAAFCRWLSEKEGLPYRLPTEAEWEYACRAGTETPFSTGESLPAEFVKNPRNSWYPDPGRSAGRQEVVPLHTAKTPANAWGLHDMHGNVEEWCSDWYGPYSCDAQYNPVGRAYGDFKVTRGGSHGTFPYYLRSANRMGTLPENRNWYIGFRVVLGDPPPFRPLSTPPEPLNSHGVTQIIPSDITAGPDPDRPYFAGPLNYVKIPAGSMGPLYSRHNHDPAVVECPNGDILAIWYTCVTERGRELAVAASRFHRGSGEWEQASPFWDAPDRNDHAPAMWFDGGRTIYHFNSLAATATWGPGAVVMRTSDDSGATWSAARLIMPEHGRRHQVIESVFKTREGFIVLPCDATPSGGGGTAIHLSADGGATWKDAGGTIAGIHAAVTQLSDGRLMAFGRGDEISENRPWMATRIRRIEGLNENSLTKSISADMGRTWSYEPSVFPPIGGGQRLILLRLAEGPLMLASFAGEDGPPLMITDAAGNKRRAIGLFAAVSFDDGKTWPHVRLVTDDGPDRTAAAMDGREFTLGFNTAEPRGYMSVCQAQNNVIHLISSWNHYRFNYKWLVTPPPAEPVSKGS